MPVTNWNSTYIDGKEYLVIDVAKFRIPMEFDPNSAMFMAVAAPDGGLGNFPALVQGDDGTTPDIDNVIDLTVLEYGDLTPDSASWDEVAPNVYQLSLTIHKGAPGADGVMVLDPDDFGTPVAGRMIVLKTDLTGFEYQAQKVGDRYFPASIANVPSGNAAYTLCPIPIPAQAFDWRPHIEGQCVITGTGADVKTHLLARLSTAGIVNGETAGPIVASGRGPIGVNASAIPHIFSSAMAAGSTDTLDKVLAGNTATIYIRTERQTGSDTYTTLAADTIASVRVCPIP